MRGSVQIARFAGIPIKIHWSFGLLILWIIFVSISSQLTSDDIFFSVSFILAIFCCVILHEYGHALMARRFGVKTRDIIVSPIGGVARLERIPHKPMQEFWIAMAGPFVNVIIVLIIFLGYLMAGSEWDKSWVIRFWLLEGEPNFIKYLFQVNLVLIAFNMLPAFPMDGGRVLRSLLSLKMNRLNATKWATYIGGFFAIGFVLVGFWASYYMLMFVGVFVLMMGQGERIQMERQAKFSMTTIGASMRQHFMTLSPFDKIEKLIPFTEKPAATGWVVMDEQNHLMGVVPLELVRDALSKGRYTENIASILSDRWRVAKEEERLDAVLNDMKDHHYSVLPVVDENGHIVGVFDRIYFYS